MCRSHFADPGDSSFPVRTSCIVGTRPVGMAYNMSLPTADTSVPDIDDALNALEDVLQRRRRHHDR